MSQGDNVAAPNMEIIDQLGLANGLSSVGGQAIS